MKQPLYFSLHQNFSQFRGITRSALVLFHLLKSFMIFDSVFEIQTDSQK